MSGTGDEPVGSVADEAAKLFGALSDWAGGRVGDVGEHLATGSAECHYCPVCRTVHAVRQASPEVRAQLATAASSFLEAAAGLLAAAAEGRTGDPHPSHDPGPRVQHIDLDLDLDLDPDVDTDIDTGADVDQDGGRS